jgi:CheY-like chemotaxis protein
MITPPLILINWDTFTAGKTPTDERREGNSCLYTKPEQAPSILNQNPLVIVIDDNKDAADSLAELFRVLGYETVVAYNGVDGLTLFSTMRPQFVFLDIAMPGMNGYEVVGRMREEENKGTIFIAVTGFGQEDDKLRSREAGFDYHLTKPINLREMREILSRHA